MRDKYILSIGTIASIAAITMMLMGASGRGTPGPTLEELDKKVSDLQANVDARALESEVDLEVARLDGNIAMRVTLETVKQEIQRQLEIALKNFVTHKQLGDQRVDIVNLIKIESDRIDNLKILVDTIDKLVKDNKVPEMRVLVDTFGVMLRGISQEQSPEVYLPRIEANMDNADFRKEMARVVNKSISPECAIYITNDTTSTVGVSVNEKIRYLIAPGDTVKAERLPTGNVTTRVDGQQIVNWAVGAPTYEHRVRLVRRDSIVTYLCR